MWLIAGLGNPGKKYDRTRHNVGFLVVDELARRAGVTFRTSWRVRGEWVERGEGPERALLLKPGSFMNRSGQVVAPLLRRKGLALSDLIVIVDDLDLECGQVRIRPRGGAGGHNGLKSVMAFVGSQDFARVRVGIGRPGPGDHSVEFVLSRFSADEQPRITEAVGRAADAIEMVIHSGMERAMNRYNS